MNNRTQAEEAALIADRMAKGLCIIRDVEGLFSTERRCLTHDCKADFGHYLDTTPAHNELGFAAND